MSLLTGEKRTATALAAEEVDCYLLGKADMQAVFAQRPSLAEEISAVLGRRETALAAIREKLDEESMRQRERQKSGDLLSRIRAYFKS